MTEPCGTSQIKHPEHQQESLSFDHPELQKLLHQIVLQNENDSDKWSYGRFDVHPYSNFLTRHGYMQGSSPSSTTQLDNPVHPIFGREFWHGPLDFATFLQAAKPALQLASLWLSHDSWILDWWEHLYYGRPRIDSKGRIYLARDACEGNIYCRGVMRRNMEDLAGRIHFVFLPPAILRDALGSCTRTTRMFAVHLAQQINSSPLSPWLFEDFADPGGPVVSLSSEFYHIALAGIPGRNGSISGGRRLQHHFQLAHTIVHELAHALMAIWHPWTSYLVEPLHSLRDTFPETGKSWEDFLFGADLTTRHSSSPLMCKEWDHSMPRLSSKPHVQVLPLATFVPESWTNRWFLKSTWENVAIMRDVLEAPSVRRDASVIGISRVREGKEELVVYHKGREVSRDSQLLCYINEYLEWSLEAPNNNQQPQSSSKGNVSPHSKLATTILTNTSINTALNSTHYTVIIREMLSKNFDPRYINMISPPSTETPSPSRIIAEYTQIWSQEHPLLFHPPPSPSSHHQNRPCNSNQSSHSNQQEQQQQPPPSSSQSSTATPTLMSPPKEPSPTSPSTTAPVPPRQHGYHYHYHYHPYMHLTLPRCQCGKCATILNAMIDAEGGIASAEVRGLLEGLQVGVWCGMLVFRGVWPVCGVEARG